MSMLYHYQQQLDKLNQVQQQRQIPSLSHQGSQVIVDKQTLVNISSNDYLGIAADPTLQQQFLSSINSSDTNIRFGSSSSRLLTGNSNELEQLEHDLEAWFATAVSADTNVKQPTNEQDNTDTQMPSALVFNSGYHANVGLLPALTKLPLKTLILSDQLVHASIIDGIRLSRCDYQIYRHNDHQHLRELINAAGAEYQRIIIVTESLFSMDGDYADLIDLVAIKHSDARVELYVDEAHAVGVLGEYGLGLAEQTGTLMQIDYLVGTFGKAFASMGAYVFCHPTIKAWLINNMRPLIFSTALPAINHAWTRFVLAKMTDYVSARQRLHQMSSHLRAVIAHISPISAVSDSHIVPYILGTNAATLAKAMQLRQAGFYALPIRPPTVPKNTSRIRLIINAGISDDEFEKLLNAL
ncbi:8-amino-7-oxononanoate synthase [Psychrobacter sp. I-STPA10]|uniref:8-amino-7-oxononanoate synthase n=1 Tax=Psychrobacter sp. I-STPA10 TaxID=2585769 RepID=UPI001E317730|nr:8-amino-7-oxononanoate synthase [Psychrobacter sp. I-STPA10]